MQSVQEKPYILLVFIFFVTLLSLSPPAGLISAKLYNECRNARESFSAVL